MNDRTKYLIGIYHDGVHFDARVRGKERYLKEKTFLDDLVGRRYRPGLPPRPIPDPPTDFYILNDEQLEAYSAFRKQLRKS